MSHAEPGAVLVSLTTRQLVGGLFELRACKPIAMEAASEPVEAWQVMAEVLIESRFESIRAARLTGFVGREHEIGLLLHRWSLAQGGEGQVMLLCGEPGIGKSRILRELRERLEEDEQAGSLRLQCSPHYVNSAFYPLIDNFERALKFERNETLEAKLDKLEALIIADYGLSREDVRFIASILSIPCEARYGAIAITPQKHKDETLRVLVDTVEAGARKQPTVMLFEDAHWADPTSLEALDLLVDRVRRIPLLIVITHRPEFQSRWPQHEHVTTLSVAKLTRSESSLMVSKLTAGRALPQDLLAQILNKADGVPLFIVTGPHWVVRGEC